MTRRRFESYIALVSATYILAAIVALGLSPGSELYATYRLALPVLTALPAAVLAGAYQRRNSFLLQLRGTWHLTLDAVQDAIQFTHMPEPASVDFAGVMKKLSVATDDFRSLFLNIREGPGDIGFYPFESLKEIQDAISGLYFSEHREARNRNAARALITDKWKQCRAVILKEFDRVEPTYSDTHWRRAGTKRSVP